MAKWQNGKMAKWQVVSLITLLMTQLNLAYAETVSIDIAATVSAVKDLDHYLEGQVNEGDTITGTYVYETTTPDSNADITIGQYLHTAAPYGIDFSVNGLRFRTDPSNVNFLVEILNNHYSGNDNYILRSYNNLFDVSVPIGRNGLRSCLEKH